MPDWKMFTPYISEEDRTRLFLHISEEDYDKTGRGKPWGPVEVTDLNTGKRYRVKGTSCGADGCFCAAVVVHDEPKRKPLTKKQFEVVEQVREAVAHITTGVGELVELYNDNDWLNDLQPPGADEFAPSSFDEWHLGCLTWRQAWDEKLGNN